MLSDKLSNDQILWLQTVISNNLSEIESMSDEVNNIVEKIGISSVIILLINTFENIIEEIPDSTNVGAWKDRVNALNKCYNEIRS